ncbi:MAG TPA: protein kinase [Polyangiaceae bacterium]|nr:protein kinase [Polyangiaceae bacterium]
MGDTQLQFGQRVADPEPAKDATATRCPSCGQHFSPDGRFCPFDGEPLVLATDWDPKNDALLDRVIDDRYHVEAVIGEGGMGRVYRVRHVLLGKPLALKALRADLASDSEIAQRFIHEARTAASVSHPGLVQISDFGTLPTGQPYLVMELLEGVPLSSLLRRHGALSPARAAAIVRKAAEAVQAAHEAGIVHRDLKPDNIHIRETDAGDEVRIVDFGLAKVVGGSRLTRAGVVFGTPHYMSPEQASGESIDPRTDVYAVGVVLYEMLTGRVPFEADTYMGVLTQHIYMKPVPPSARLGHPKGVEALEAVALRCLEKQPARRYASMTELVAALSAIPLASLPNEPLGVAAPLSSDELTRGVLDSGGLPLLPERRFWPLALGALFACSVLGGLAARTMLGRAAAPASSALGASPASPVTVAPSATPRVIVREPAAPPVGGASSAPQPSAQPAEMLSSRRPPSNPPRLRANEAAVRKPARRGDIIDPWANR